MKAPEFDYVRPATIDDALTLLRDEKRDAQPIAGGQSLMPLLNFRLATPQLLVDLNALSTLSGITENGNLIQIGAMTRHVEIETSPIIAEHLPLLRRAMRDVAHLAIRNRGTLGGSVALADPAGEMPACCLAYDGVIMTRSQSGVRKIAASEFFKGAYQTALEPGELVIAIEFPKQSERGRCFGFGEIVRRRGDYALAGIALTSAGKTNIADARIVLFGVSDRPVRARGAEDAVNGMEPGPEAAATAASRITDGIDIFGDLHASKAMKEHLANVLAQRIIQSFVSEAV